MSVPVYRWALPENLEPLRQAALGISDGRIEVVLFTTATQVLHLLEYAGLGLLLCRALVGERLALWSAVVLAILMTSAYGASDEWHQAFVPSRTSDVQDWLTDGLGATAGAAGFALLKHARGIDASAPRRS